MAGLLWGCGYRAVARAPLPGGLRSVVVEPVQVGRTDEPALGPLLARGLVEQLTARGVAAHTLRSGGAAARLSCRVVSLEQGGVPVVRAAERALAARDLVLVVELKLTRAGGETLWRSGLLEVRLLRPAAQQSAAIDEAARMEVLRRLAVQAAQDAVELMY